MARKDFKVNIKGLDEFLKKLKSATSGELHEQYKLWLNAIGNDFIGIVQDQIIGLDVKVDRRLLNSFQLGNEDSVFEIAKNGLALEVGTNVQYAQWVNDGHWTNPQGKKKRWVPGYWNGKKFVYDKTAKTGMLLKQHFVEGSHYFDISLKIFEKILAASMEKKLQEWLDTF